MRSPSGGTNKVIIVGAGLGGLLTAAYLSSLGREVVVLEALDVLGGRFTHLDFEGFAVPTGAFHMLPGGTTGPLFQCLQRVGLTVPLVEPRPAFTVVSEGTRHALDLSGLEGGGTGLLRSLGIASKRRLQARIALVAALGAVGADLSAAAMVAGLSAKDHAVRVLDHLTGFACGVSAPEASAVELLRSLKRQHFGRKAFLLEGNRSLVEGLAALARSRGCELRTRTRVSRLTVDRGRVTGVVTADGEHLTAGCVISNAGLARTTALLGAHAPRALQRRCETAIPAAGVAYAIRSRQPLQRDASVEITADLDFIAGLTPVSNICPALSPPGWSYSLAYQVLTPNLGLDEQLERAQAELRLYLGDAAEVFNTAIYRGAHPAASVAQRLGQHGRGRVGSSVAGVAGLHLVGHDVRGYGTAAEVIGDSCLKLWEALQ